MAHQPVIADISPRFPSFPSVENASNEVERDLRARLIKKAYTAVSRHSLVATAEVFAPPFGFQYMEAQSERQAR